MIEFIMYLAEKGLYRELEEMEREKEISDLELYQAKYQFMTSKAPALSRLQRRQIFQTCPTFAALTHSITSLTAPGSRLVVNDILRIYSA